MPGTKESLAHGERATPEVVDLSELPEAYQIGQVRYCDGKFEVGTEDGKIAFFADFNLLFKVDTGAHGPAPGRPVLVPADTERTRAFVVAASPADVTKLLARMC